MGRVYFWKTFSEGSGEPDSHIVESQNYPLHISDDAREGFLANLLFDLPVVAIPHVSTPTPGQIVPVCMRRFWRGGFARRARVGAGSVNHRNRQRIHQAAMIS
jgi:hypothetical protein